jgi:hypothetical protein
MKRPWIPLALFLAGAPAFAFDEEPPPADVMFFGHGMRAGGPDELVFLGAEHGVELRTVKGAPYQAESVTEVSQVLADGNRISRKHTGAVYRDSEGRVRREQVFAGIRGLAPDEAHKTVFIHDPVAQLGWVLDAEEKVARKLPAPGSFKGARRAGRAGDPERPRLRRHGGEEQSLGTQLVEGVEATGTRVVHDIPAGSIGNEKAIEIVHERWYSPELQTVVLSRRSDPRFGETVYRLTNIQRTEPDHALFAVPEGYKVEDKPGRLFQKRLRAPRRPRD